MDNNGTGELRGLDDDTWNNVQGARKLRRIMVEAGDWLEAVRRSGHWDRTSKDLQDALEAAEVVWAKDQDTVDDTSFAACAGALQSAWQMALRRDPPLYVEKREVAWHDAELIDKIRLGGVPKMAFFLSNCNTSPLTVDCTGKVTDPNYENAYELPRLPGNGDTGRMLNAVFNAVPVNTEVVLFYLKIDGCGTGGEPNEFVLDVDEHRRIKVMPNELISAFDILRRKGVTLVLLLHSCAGSKYSAVVESPAMSIATDTTTMGVHPMQGQKVFKAFYEGLDGDRPRDYLELRVRELRDNLERVVKEQSFAWGAIEGSEGQTWQLFTNEDAIKETIYMPMWNEVVEHYVKDTTSKRHKESWERTNEHLYDFVCTHHRFDYAFCSKQFGNAKDFIEFINKLSKFDEMVLQCSVKLCSVSIKKCTECEATKIMNEVYFSAAGAPSRLEILDLFQTTDALFNAVMKADAGSHFKVTLTRDAYCEEMEALAIYHCMLLGHGGSTALGDAHPSPCQGRVLAVGVFGAESSSGADDIQSPGAG